jgi:hypothetical protein
MANRLIDAKLQFQNLKSGARLSRCMTDRLGVNIKDYVTAKTLTADSSSHVTTPSLSFKCIMLEI